MVLSYNLYIYIHKIMYWLLSFAPGNSAIVSGWFVGSTARIATDPYGDGLFDFSWSIFK